jgi:hypothetical protein
LGKRLTFPQALAGQLNPMCPVNDAVEDRIPEGRILNDLMPSEG